MSWIQSLKENSRRLKQEWMQSLGVYDEYADPDFDSRAKHFMEMDESLDRIKKASNTYLEKLQQFSQASVILMHEYSSFFLHQIQATEEGSSERDNLTYLIQSSQQMDNLLRVLHTDLVEVIRESTQLNVSKSIDNIRFQTNEILETLKSRRQKALDFDYFRRAKSNRKDSSNDDDELKLAEQSLLRETKVATIGFQSFEKKRSSMMKHEFLYSVSTIVYFTSRSNEIVEQILPVLPSLAQPLATLGCARQMKARYSGSKLDEPLNTQPMVSSIPVYTDQLRASLEYDETEKIYISEFQVLYTDYRVTLL